MGAVDSLHLLVVAEVSSFVEQGDDPLGVDLQGGGLLPEPLAGAPVAPLELGRGQLAHQLEQQLPLLQFGEAAREGWAVRRDRGMAGHRSTPGMPSRASAAGPAPPANHTKRIDRYPSPVPAPLAMLNSLRSRPPLDPSPGPEPPPDPAALPPPGAPARWPFLQALRRARPFPLDPWLAAIEAGRLEPLPDLLAALAERLDAPAAERLLRWWLAAPAADPGLPERILRRRDVALARLLRQALAADPAPRRQLALLPLLGHQRQPADFFRLRDALRAPRSTPLRAAALEGLILGLSAWPRAPLRRLLAEVALDLDPGLAAAALDALARLPDARRDLLPLRQRALDPALAQRLERRLASLPAAPLLLVVHGRAGGVVPAAWRQLAAELERRRGAPVALRALTEPDPGPPPRGSRPLGVVPLLLLPGGHVRHDLPEIVAALRRDGPLRRWPFLGAWPAWRQALAAEAAALATAAGGGRPLLLHHPLEGPLARRHLRELGRLCAADVLAAPYSSADPEELALPIRGPVLPLALAANRLTEALAPRLGPAAAAPLLERPRLRSALLAALEALP